MEDDIPTRTLDIVVPIYNEAESLPHFHASLRSVADKLPYRTRIIYVNDGSTDSTADILVSLAITDPLLVVVELSRNFGHQAALTAGLDVSNADLLVTLDGDGQHPPELIPQMIELHQLGYDLVLTQRNNDQSLSFLKRSTSLVFYRLINLLGNTKIIPGSADYRLITQQVAQAIKAMPEHHRFLRGMISWIGFRSVILPYDAPQRLAGKSKYSILKMLRLASEAMFSFSVVPIQAAVAVGIAFLVLAFLEALYVLSFWIRGLESQLAPGWSSLMFIQLAVGGTVIVVIGIIGIYVGYIFQEVKRRPLYFIRTVKGDAKPAEDRPQHDPTHPTAS